MWQMSVCWQPRWMQFTAHRAQSVLTFAHNLFQWQHLSSGTWTIWSLTSNIWERVTFNTTAFYRLSHWNMLLCCLNLFSVSQAFGSVPLTRSCFSNCITTSPLTPLFCWGFILESFFFSYFTSQNSINTELLSVLSIFKFIYFFNFIANGSGA